MRRSATLAACLFVASACAAQTRDYSKGFARLYEAGLPDVAKAEYVKLDSSSRYFAGDRFGSQVPGLDGAWLLEPLQPGQPGRFILDQGRQVAIYDLDQLEKLRAEERKRKPAAGPEEDVAEIAYGPDGMAADGRIGGRWKKADLAADVRKVVAHLKGLDSTEENRRSLPWELRANGGRILLFAAHAYRQGLTNDANAMVEALFQATGDSRRVLVQSVDHLVNCQYEDAYAAFQRSSDWAQFHAALAGLLARYPTGWRKSAAARRLDGLIAARAAMKTPPDIPGAGLTDEDQALARELCTAPGGQRYSMFMGGGFWLLADPKPRRFAPSMSGKQRPDAATRIEQRGLKSVPLLIAMLGDQTLTLWSSTTLRGGTWEESYDDSDAGVDATERLFSSMNRPALRCEIARSLLDPLLIASDEDRYRRSRQSLDEFREQALAWYERCGAKPPRELATLYMEEGNSDQKRAALRYLFGALDKSELPTLEKYLVDADNPQQSMDIVMEYASLRGKEAEPFVTQYIAQFTQAVRKEAADEQGGRRRYGTDRAEYYTNQVAQLHSLIAGASLQDTLKDVAAGKQDLDAARSLMSRQLQREKPEEALAMVLQAAVDAQEPAVRSGLLQYAAIGRPGSEFDGVQEQAAAGKPPDIRAQAALWKTLLADTRPADEDSAGSCVADVAARQINALYAPANDRRPSRGTYLLYQLGKRTETFIRARAEALLEGKAPPPYPTVEDIGPEQSKQVAEKLTKAAPEALDEVIRNLSLQDWMALLRGAADNKELNRRLAPRANRIAEVQPIAGDAETAQIKKELEGQTLDRKAVDRLVAFCRKRVDAKQPITVSIARGPCLEGVTVRISNTPSAAKHTKPGRAPAPLAGGVEQRLAGMVAQQEQMPVVATWESGTSETAVAPAHAVTSAPEDALFAEAVQSIDQELKADAEKRKAAFWTAVDALNGEQGNACAAATIRLTSSPGEMLRRGSFGAMPFDMIE